MVLHLAKALEFVSSASQRCAPPSSRFVPYGAADFISVFMAYLVRQGYILFSLLFLFLFFWILGSGSGG